MTKTRACHGSTSSGSPRQLCPVTHGRSGWSLQSWLGVDAQQHVVLQSFGVDGPVQLDHSHEREEGKRDGPGQEGEEGMAESWLRTVF